MKVVAFLGSPMKEGNSATICNAFLEGIKEKGGDVSTFYLNGLNIKPCQGCRACKKEDMENYCLVEDDMTKLYKEMQEADLIVVASPVYFGEVSAQTKVFMDRWFAFLDGNFKSRLKSGKKLQMIFSQGQGEEGLFSNIPKRMERMCNLLKIELLPPFVGTGLIKPTDAKEKKDLLDRAKNLGASF